MRLHVTRICRSADEAEGMRQYLLVHLAIGLAQRLHRHSAEGKERVGITLASCAMVPSERLLDVLRKTHAAFVKAPLYGLAGGIAPARAILDEPYHIIGGSHRKCQAYRLRIT